MQEETVNQITPDHIRAFEVINNENALALVIVLLILTVLPAIYWGFSRLVRSFDRSNEQNAKMFQEFGHGIKRQNRVIRKISKSLDGMNNRMDRIEQIALKAEDANTNEETKGQSCR